MKKRNRTHEQAPKKKGVYESATETPDNNPLMFWVDAGNGVPQEVDLSEFFFGRRKEEVSGQARRMWGGDFAGRPGLAKELALYVRAKQPRKGDLVHIRSAFRHLFRFLDNIDPEKRIASSCDLTDGHGSSLLLSFHNRKSGKETDRQTYGTIKTTVAALRSDSGCGPLFWPTVPHQLPTLLADIDALAVKRLRNALVAEARQIKAMFCEGDSLAEAGSDPRDRVGRTHSGAWSRQNHARLIRNLNQDFLPTRRELCAMHKGKVALLGLQNSLRTAPIQHGPAYLAPTMGENAHQGAAAKLRWFFPSREDTGVFLLLFLIGTGWNLSTALAINVSDPSNWVEPHPQKSGAMVLHAFKERSHRHQFAISPSGSEWSPYEIVRFMLERTEPLRRTLLRRLNEHREAFNSKPSPKLKAEMANLERAMASPWLFHSLNSLGKIGFYPSDGNSGFINKILRAVVERHKLAIEFPSLRTFTTGDMRDAFIGHTYTQSGYNVLITQLAAQHNSPRTLRHYLNRRGYRAHGEAQIRKLQDVTLVEINNRRPLDPTRLRLLIQQGFVTEEQAQRLTDYRQRTRLGMGCLDPLHPPKMVAPGHPNGQICRLQRCLGCPHGVVFEDSLPSLARAYAELVFLKSQIGFAAWIGSSFEVEEKSLLETLAVFDGDKVKSETDDWLRQLRNGQVAVHEVFPVH